MAVVSTGQITIIDQNDARTITAYLSTNRPYQQVFTKDDQVVSYVPEYVANTLIITPRIFVGGVNAASDLSSNTVQITNRKWTKGAAGGNIWVGGTTTQDTTSFVAANGTTPVNAPFSVSANGVTLTIAGNLKDSLTNYPIYFECDYTDPTTGLVTKVISEIALNVIKTGTNAVFVSIRGRTVIEESTGQTKNATAITADLVRPSGIEKTSLIYRWYNVTTGSAVQISTSLSGYDSQYRITDTATTAVPTVVATNGGGVPTLNNGSRYNASGVPESNTDHAAGGNTLVISETAIADIAVYRVDIEDFAESKTYNAYFTVYDIADPYEVVINSTTGDKLVNGQGSTTLSPRVYYGATEVTPLTGWTFTWTFFDRFGKRAAFVDAGDIASASSFYNGGNGRPISANTTGTSASITFEAITPVPTVGTATGERNIVKILKDGVATYYEISAATATTVTLKATGLTALNYTDYPAPAAANQFAGGVIYLCTINGLRTGSSIVVTGADIDSKGRITCSADRP